MKLKSFPSRPTLSILLALTLLTPCFACRLNAQSFTSNIVAIINADCSVVEGQSGSAFLTITNFTTFYTATAVIDSISLSSGGLHFLSGEADDAVTSYSIGATPSLPLTLPPGSWANYRIDFQTDDLVHDTDIDSGLWALWTDVIFHFEGEGPNARYNIGAAFVIVNDVPEPSSMGLALVGMLVFSVWRLCHKKHAS